MTVRSLQRMIAYMQPQAWSVVGTRCTTMPLEPSKLTYFRRVPLAGITRSYSQTSTDAPNGVPANKDTNGDFLDFVLAELRPRLDKDAWTETSEFLQAHCKQNGGTGDPLLLEEHCAQADSWMNWARKMKRNVKTVSEKIPDGILPPNCTALLHDVKVAAKGPDDIIYDANEILRKKVARGNSFLTITSPPQNAVTYSVIYAMKKFTGGLGDDDDREEGDNATWKLYFSKSLDDCKSVVCTSKANGEAAHLSAVLIGGEYYLCAGSKNVHMLFRNKADLEKYDPKNNRYGVAREICNCVLETLDSLSPEKRQSLIKFLAAMRLTAVFEILNPDHPHIEDLSFLPGPQMKFIAWTSLDVSDAADNSICWLPPDVSIEVAQIFGLSTVDYTVIDIKDVDDRMSKIRQYHNSEGEVLFFMDEERKVIGMLKKKSVWYVLVRAIREKVRRAVNSYHKNPETFKINPHVQNTTGRIDQIQKWLGLDKETADAWKLLGTDFLIWIVKEVQCNGLDREDVTTRFPIHWQRFLDLHQRTDKIDLHNCVSK